MGRQEGFSCSVLFAIFIIIFFMGIAAGDEITLDPISNDETAIQIVEQNSNELNEQALSGTQTQVMESGESDNSVPLPSVNPSSETVILGESPQPEGTDTSTEQAIPEISQSQTPTILPSPEITLVSSSLPTSVMSTNPTTEVETPCIQCEGNKVENLEKSQIEATELLQIRQKELKDVQLAIQSKNKNWQAGITSVSNLPDDERKKMLGAILLSHENTSSSAAESVDSALQSLPNALGLPSSLDWRDNGGDFTTPIRDQGQCGSCWAFATLGAFESRMELAYNNPNLNPDLAEQDLVSCTGCGGCSGASMPCPLNWIRDYGAMNESCYPYVARDTSCNPGCSRSYRISEWHQVTPLNNENAIKEALTRGPVIGTFNVYTDFYYYKNGIYEHTWGSLEGGHAIVIVGWGQDERGTYWICKNSWGTGWGEVGWFKIRSGNCGINDELYELTVTPPAPLFPQVNFIGTPAQGIRPLTVQFTDLSTNSPISWNWNFGDGSTNSTVQNPLHTYTAAGSYTVTLTATNSFGSNTTQKSNYITVTPPPPFLPGGWSYRKLHTIAGSSSGDITDYQVRFKLWNTTGTDSGENVYLGNNVTPDFRDIRFTTTDNTVLPYWVQETGSNYAVVWVRIPSIPTTGTQVYLYYGNPQAVSISNGDDTFLFFDDFQGTALNITKWNPTLIPYNGGTGSYSVSGGNLTLSSTNNYGVSLRTQNPIPANPSGYCIGQKLHVVSGGSYAQYRTVFSDSTNADPGTNNGIFISKYDNLVRFTVNSIYSTAPQPFVHQSSYLWTIAGNAILMKDDTTIVALSNNPPSLPDSSRYLRLWVYNYAVSKTDTIFVARYAGPEPTHGSWSAAEFNPVPPSILFTTPLVSG